MCETLPAASRVHPALLLSCPARPPPPWSPEPLALKLFLPRCDWVLKPLFLVSGSETICVVEVFPTSQQLFPVLDLEVV